MANRPPAWVGDLGWRTVYFIIANSLIFSAQSIVGLWKEFLIITTILRETYFVSEKDYEKNDPHIITVETANMQVVVETWK